MHSIGMSIVCPVLLAAGFWLAFGACVDVEAAVTPPLSRVLVAWDPLACHDDHRVAIELTALADDAIVTRSVPCAVGWMPLDVPHVGEYRARVDIVSASALPQLAFERDLDIEAPVVRWTLDEPP